MSSVIRVVRAFANVRSWRKLHLQRGTGPWGWREGRYGLSSIMRRANKELADWRRMGDVVMMLAGGVGRGTAGEDGARKEGGGVNAELDPGAAAPT